MAGFQKSQVTKKLEGPNIGDERTAIGASLVLIHPPMAGIGQCRPLTKKITVVGRDDTADITVPRTSISRRHAEIRQRSGQWLLADMDSTNGTLLNDVEVQDDILEDGDHIQFGDATFKFVLGDSVKYHDKIYALTVLDGLTSIYNERYFKSHLGRMLEKAKKRQTSAALVLFDIDWFGDLNEERGKLCGDMVLRNLARRIVGHMSSSHVCARTGGQEFAVFLRSGDLDDAQDLAENIRKAIGSKSFSFENDEFSVSVSAGVAACNTGDLSTRELFTESRKQLRAAKQQGRNRVSP